MSKFPSQEMDRFNVRLPAGMREAIANRAEQNGRSMNSEIVQILSDALHIENTEEPVTMKGSEFVQLLESTKRLVNHLETSYKNNKKKPT